MTELYTYYGKIWEADQDSFSVCGRRFFIKDQIFNQGDFVKITIQKVEAQCPPSAATPPEASSNS